MDSSANSQDIPYQLLGQLELQSPLQGIADHTGHDPTQALTTAYITTMYYSALSNLYIQSLLPVDAEEFADMPRLKIALDRTKNDYYASAKWLTEHGGEFIDKSSAKSYYYEILALRDGSITDSAVAYAQDSEATE